MPKYHGKGGVLYLAVNNAGSAVRVANLSQWSINLQADKSDVSALGDDWKSYVRGLKGGTLKASGFWADDADVPYDAFDADEKVSAYLYPSKSAPSKFWSGYIWPDAITCDAPVSGPVAMSMDGTFDGTVSRA